MDEPVPKDPKEAHASRRRRQEVAELNRALAEKRCPNCNTLGAWRLYNQDKPGGRIRYVRCIGCGHNDHVPVILESEDEKGE